MEAYNVIPQVDVSRRAAEVWRTRSPGDLEHAVLPFHGICVMEAMYANFVTFRSARVFIKKSMTAPRGFDVSLNAYMPS